MSNQTKHISSQGEVMYPEILEKIKCLIILLCRTYALMLSNFYFLIHAH